MVDLKAVVAGASIAYQHSNLALGTTLLGCDLGFGKLNAHVAGLRLGVGVALSALIEFSTLAISPIGSWVILRVSGVAI